MNIVKKICIVLVMVLQTIIRLPISFLAMLFVMADAGLIKLHVRLAKVLDCAFYTEALYDVQNNNIAMAEYFEEYFEDLQESLE